MDQQAAHKSLFAEAAYARGAEEAPGHVSAKKLQYQIVSREWHAFIGFQIGVGARKQVLAKINVQNYLAMRVTAISFHIILFCIVHSLCIFFSYSVHARIEM